jgi:hypothetical protein
MGTSCVARPVTIAASQKVLRIMLVRISLVHAAPSTEIGRAMYSTGPHSYQPHGENGAIELVRLVRWLEQMVPRTSANDANERE